MSDKKWLLDVIDDLSDFTIVNGMPKLANMLAEAKQVAEQEIDRKNVPVSPPEVEIIYISGASSTIH